MDWGESPLFDSQVDSQVTLAQAAQKELEALDEALPHLLRALREDLRAGAEPAIIREMELGYSYPYATHFRHINC